MNHKVAIVTGGTGAIGRAISFKLSDEGIKIYVPTRDLAKFNEVFDRSQNADTNEFNLNKIFSFNCDITDENSVIEFVNNICAIENGRIDYLINTAGGIDNPVKTAELKTKSLLNMLDLNFMSAFYFSREVLKYMLKNNFGRIISFGSKSSTEITADRFAYSFSKRGVIDLMNILSEENKDFNIRCNTIIPGIVDTPSNREWGDEDDFKKWTNTNDIAEIVSDLLKDKFKSLRSSELKLYNSV
ncbi:MAG TPA: SDR family oxidoreductase [Ignavibacteria bacterium]|nr:SDR family oxidoreductase [Ignavibacteria bacterium]HRK00556.1 SDR family oxidoreductase [Ignavibacteria bacterium]